MVRSQIRNSVTHNKKYLFIVVFSIQDVTARWTNTRDQERTRDNGIEHGIKYDDIFRGRKKKNANTHANRSEIQKRVTVIII